MDARRYPGEGQYEAFDDLMPGDVVRWHGRLRKVREVAYYPDDRVRSVGFAKLRCSGYPSPLTLYWRTEIRAAYGGTVARGTSLCTTPLECALTRQVEEDPRDHRSLRVTEHDVVGMIY
jgi:hypothetical protein